MQKISQERAKDINVLVVDDHFPTRDMVKTILRSVGFSNIIQADDGSTALLKLAENDTHLVICDWNMPGISGIELLKKVRQKEQYENLPFLMLTAEAYRENVQEAIALGVTDYITKPFTAEVLIKKVTECLPQVAAL